MSKPEFPKTDSSLTRDQAINQVLSSIAMEELGLSHIINAEGEKIQYALGTLNGASGPEQPLSIDDLLALNESVRDTLDGAMQNQLILKSKMQAALASSIMQGPTGERGPITTILDSYDTLVDLKTEHPIGELGDAYLVAGILYVWDLETKDWKESGNLIGPTGPQGVAGPVGTILDSYENLIDLETEHKTGSQGDAYLVAGELYVWNVLDGKWESVGDLIGPTGTTGPTGDTGPVGTILESFVDYQALIDKHPKGKQGDAYLVAGTLYVWDTINSAWKETGNLIGPTGATGPRGPIGLQGETGPQGMQGLSGVGGTIKGVLTSTDQLETITGNPGDLYLVGDVAVTELDLYVWNETDKDWQELGQFKMVQGPTGPQGERGETGPTGPVGTILASYETEADLKKDHPDGNQGDAYLVGGDLYVWNSKIPGWEKIGRLSGPTGPEGPEAASYIIIPFASSEAPRTYANNGVPTGVSLLGFGYGDRRDELISGKANYSIQIDPTDYSFFLTQKAAGNNENKQLVFSLPFNVILKSIYITVGNWGTFNTNNGTIFPYVQLYKADPESNHFKPIEDAFAKPEQGIGPGFSIPADTMRYAFNNKLNIPLKAGTRIGIGGMMEIKGDMKARDYWLYFTGGIGMVYDPNPKD